MAGGSAEAGAGSFSRTGGMSVAALVSVISVRKEDLLKQRRRPEGRHVWVGCAPPMQCWLACLHRSAQRRHERHPGDRGGANDTPLYQEINLKSTLGCQRFESEGVREGIVRYPWRVVWKLLNPDTGPSVAARNCLSATT
jgi:hypothetical protein